MIYPSPHHPTPSPTRPTTLSISRQHKHKTRYKSHPRRQNLRPQSIPPARGLYRDGRRGCRRSVGTGSVRTAGRGTRTARGNDRRLQNKSLCYGAGDGQREDFAVGLSDDLAEDRRREEKDECEQGAKEFHRGGQERRRWLLIRRFAREGFEGTKIEERLSAPGRRNVERERSDSVGVVRRKC